jgi:hypothetical protein
VLPVVDVRVVGVLVVGIFPRAELEILFVATCVVVVVEGVRSLVETILEEVFPVVLGGSGRRRPRPGFRVAAQDVEQVAVALPDQVVGGDALQDAPVLGAGDFS